MKIAGTMISKNESDIIESIVRYSCCFLDELYFFDNGSSDDTTQMVQRLSTEGLPVTIFSISRIDEIVRKYNLSARYAAYPYFMFDMMHADIHLHVDSDEFWFDTCGGNPRAEIERLGSFFHAAVKRQNYVYEKDPDDNARFLPDCFPTFVPPPAAAHGKIIMTREMWDAGIRPTDSYHRLHVPQGVTLPQKETSLRIAHYPLRNTTQVMLKMLVSWLQFSGAEVRGLDEGQHWRRMYEFIQQNGVPTKEMLVQLCKTSGYSRYDGDIMAADIPTEYGPLDTAWCGDKLTLRYTDYSQFNGLTNHFLNVFTKSMEELFKLQRRNLMKLNIGPAKDSCVKQRGVDHDGWCGPDVELLIATGAKGAVSLTGYYPHAPSGNECLTLYVDGVEAARHTVVENLFHIHVPAPSNQSIALEIACNFAFKAAAPDVRTLSYVLSDIHGE